MGEDLISQHHFAHSFFLFNIFFTVLGEIFFYFPVSPWIFHFCGLFTLVHVIFAHFPVFWLIFYQQMDELLLFFICFAHVQTLYGWNFFLARWIFLLWDFFIHKIRVAKGGTQLSGCQIAQSRSYFPALCNTLPKWQTALPAFHHEPQPAGTAKIPRVITYLTAETVKRTCTAK